MNLQLSRLNSFYLPEILCLLAGLAITFSFAPYDFYVVQFPLLVIVFLACYHTSPRRALLRGYLFGIGWFVHGIHWVYFSLHYHGGTPEVLAYVIVFMLAAFLALFPALAFYLANRFYPQQSLPRLVLAYPLLLLIMEWLRGYFLTGFPWVQLGYAQIDSWLAAYAPLIGGLGVTGMLLLVSGLLAYVMQARRYRVALPAVVLIFAIGAGLQQIEWTTQKGDTIKVSMIQGNIPQSEKWKPEYYYPTLDLYRSLTEQQADSDLVIWPETAVPGFRHYIEDYLQGLKAFGEETDTEILTGLFIRDDETGRYYNAVVDMQDQVYLKRHLVPLGEYFPLRPLLGFFSRWIDIPMSDLDSGPLDQPLMQIAGHRLGINICFEDAFDRDVLRDLPEANILVNVSNDAWFEDSIEPWQHHQIARMRALETGRSLIRLTNTGVSSIIGPDGRVQVQAEQFRRMVLSGEVQAYSGSTPYVLWANYPLVTLALLVLFAARKYLIKKK